MKNNNWVFWLIGLGSMAFMSFVLWQNYLYATDLGKDYQGLFGDMFGAANALFTGLSFVGVIIAILLQRQELKLQRNELELTRNEMEQTRDEFIEQNETLRVQRFENTFFQMITLLSNIIENIEFEWGNELVKSRKAINKMAYSLGGYLIEEMHTDEFSDRIKYLNFATQEEAVTENDLVLVYNRLYKERNDLLGHYFRTLYHLVKFVHETDNIDRKRYMSIIRAQLSNSEQILLFYNCLHENGKEKFKPLVESYSLLHNIDLSFLPNKGLKEVYKDTAYETKAS